jgi:hypothetical protein
MELDDAGFLAVLEVTGKGIADQPESLGPDRDGNKKGR